MRQRTPYGRPTIPSPLPLPLGQNRSEKKRETVTQRNFGLLLSKDASLRERWVVLGSSYLYVLLLASLKKAPHLQPVLRQKQKEENRKHCEMKDGSLRLLLRVTVVWFFPGSSTKTRAHSEHTEFAVPATVAAPWVLPNPRRHAASGQLFEGLQFHSTKKQTVVLRRNCAI